MSDRETFIVRGPRPEHFTVVRNAIIDDPQLSFQALGLLTYILSKPDHWRCNREQLAESHDPDTVYGVRQAMKELAEAGYVTRERRRGEHGRVEWVTYVYETPGQTTGRISTNGATREDDETPGETVGRSTAGGEPTVLVKTEGAKTENQRARQLCDQLADAIAQDGSKRPTVSAGWVTDMDRMMRLDGRSPEQVERTIRWLFADAGETACFWRSNIQSPAKLRKHWDTMRKRREAEKRKDRVPPQPSEDELERRFERFRR